MNRQQDDRGTGGPAASVPAESAGRQSAHVALPHGHVLAIVGMPGAGKSTAADWLRAQGASVVRLGETVVNEVARRGLPLTPENEKLVREQLRQTGGVLVLAKTASERVVEELAAGKFVVLDGVYSLSEHLFFKRRLHDQLLVVAIHASPAIRYSRLVNRPERPLTPVQALQRDIAELRNLDKGGSIALADAVIENNGEPAELTAQLEHIMQNWHAILRAAGIPDFVDLVEQAEISSLL